MEEALMEAKGIDGRVLLFKDFVRIKRSGMGNLLSGASRVEQDILISQIVSIQFKKAGLLNNGYMELTLMHNYQRRGRDSDSEINDSMVSFRPGQQSAFEALRQAIEGRLAGGGVGRPPSAATTDLDELDKLASLRDRGVITEEEFDRKKKQLLGL